MPAAERWMLNIKQIMHPFEYYSASILNQVWNCLMFDIQANITLTTHNVSIALCKQRKYPLHEDNIVQSQQFIAILPADWVPFNDVWCLQRFYRDRMSRLTGRTIVIFCITVKQNIFVWTIYRETWNWWGTISFVMNFPLLLLLEFWASGEYFIINPFNITIFGTFW